MNKLITLALLLFTSQSYAQEATVQVSYNEIRNCATGRCEQVIVKNSFSATAFGTWSDQDRIMLITCAHGFWKTGPHPKIEIVMNNMTIPARVEALAKEASGYDLAVISAPRNGQQLPYTRIASQPTAIGANVSLRSTLYGSTAGTVQGYATQGQSKLIIARYTRQTIKGDSGSAILSDGLIHGVHILGKGQTGYAVDAPTIHKWLDLHQFNVYGSRNHLDGSPPTPINSSNSVAGTATEGPTLPAGQSVQLCRCSTAIVSLEKQIQELKSELQLLASKPAPINTDQMARIATLEMELAKIRDIETPVRTHLPNGEIFSEDRVHLFQGDAIQFHLVPRTTKLKPDNNLTAN